LVGFSSGTTYGAGSPGNINNLNCMSVQIQATVHYNNGCPNETINHTIHPSSRVVNNIIYPNPTYSEVKVDLSSILDKGNLSIVIVDIDSGQEVYNKAVSKLNDSNEITIGGLNKYRFIQVMVLNNGKVINKSKITIE
jgi:hypothetical protein